MHAHALPAYFFFFDEVDALTTRRGKWVVERLFKLAPHSDGWSRKAKVLEHLFKSAPEMCFCNWSNKLARCNGSSSSKARTFWQITSCFSARLRGASFNLKGSCFYLLCKMVFLMAAQARLRLISTFGKLCIPFCFWCMSLLRLCETAPDWDS